MLQIYVYSYTLITFVVIQFRFTLVRFNQFNKWIIDVLVNVNGKQKVEVVPVVPLHLKVLDNDSLALHDDLEQVLGLGQPVVIAPEQGNRGRDILQPVEGRGCTPVVRNIRLVVAPVEAHELPGVDPLGVVEDGEG